MGKHLAEIERVGQCQVQVLRSGTHKKAQLCPLCQLRLLYIPLTL